MLQAADVLAYRADEVPVGDDQRQHIELMREIARRFNERFAPEGEEILVVPEHRIPEVGARIMDLQSPDSKMATTGGSEQGTVYVLDEPDVVRKKFRSAVTDSGTEVRRAPDKAGISNLIEILAVVRGVDPADVEREFEGSGYGDFKGAAAEEVAAFLAPGARALRRAAPGRGGARDASSRPGPSKARAIAAGDARRRPRGDGRRPACASRAAG